MSPSIRPRLVPADASARVTTVELFFDLVFVFGLTQVTALMASDLSWTGVLRGLMVLALIWWSWVGYAWLCNVMVADEDAARLVLFAAMGAMFVLALCIPEAFTDLPGGLSGPVVLAACYFAFRALHLTLFWILARGDPGLRMQLLRFTPAMLAGTLLLLLASQFEGAAQTSIWALALLADYGGTFLGGAGGWRIRSVGHFAERHGLIVIVALGESIVAIGVGVAADPVSWPIIAACLLGLAISGGLWWCYFDITAQLAEHAFEATPPAGQARLARDAYSFLHFPIIAGIVLLALGLKKIMEYVGDTEHHDLSESLSGIPLYALYGGVALYLLGLVAFRFRAAHAIDLPRLVASALLLALLPIGAAVPALAALAILSVAVTALVAFDVVRHRELRDRIHHRELIDGR